MEREVKWQLANPGFPVKGLPLKCCVCVDEFLRRYLLSQSVRWRLSLLLLDGFIFWLALFFGRPTS